LAVTRLWGVPAPMRDGAALNTDVYLPDAGPEGGPYPGVLLRTPYYNQAEPSVAIAGHLAAHGYAVALQDVCGRYGSDGEWEPFRREGRDGYDAVEWLAAQPWCTGRVGTMGISYEGSAQWALARERPPHLVTMVSTAAAGRWMEELPFDRGVLAMAMLPWLHAVSGRVGRQPWLVADLPEVLRGLPLHTLDERLGHTLPLWREWLEHPRLDDYWRELRLTTDDFRRIELPVLHITGWYDDDQPGALFLHAGMCEHSPRAADQHLVIGPWDHRGTRTPAQSFGGVDFGPAALEDIAELHRRWFDHWLKGEPDGPWPESRARVFLGGANAWRTADAWPPRDAVAHTLYLRGQGRANTMAGDGQLGTEPPTASEPADRYTYDPADPVPSDVDPRFFAPDQVETPLDERFKHRRDDVLVYTGARLEAALVIAGNPVVHLFAATDGPDTDWFAALHDLAPSGASQLLAAGRMAGRFADGLEREVPLEPDVPREFAIALSAVGHQVRPGHRLRLTITSSDFPRWARNPNTGEPFATATTLRAAINRVFHEPARPSRVVLPVATGGLPS
jgi:putative CocE/NonD family hydrolase